MGKPTVTCGNRKGRGTLTLAVFPTCLVVVLGNTVEAGSDGIAVVTLAWPWLANIRNFL
jgi:hypothetical protein